MDYLSTGYTSNDSVNRKKMKKKRSQLSVDTKRSSSSKRGNSALKSRQVARLEKKILKPDIYCRLKPKKYIFSGEQNHNFQKYVIQKIDLDNNFIIFKPRSDDESALDNYQNKIPLIFECPNGFIKDSITNAEMHQTFF